jgi:hypothetical protein
MTASTRVNSRASRTSDGWLNADFRHPWLHFFSARHELPSQRLRPAYHNYPVDLVDFPACRERVGPWKAGGGSVASWTYPRIHPKLRRLTRKYRCLGGIPCAVKSLKVKIRCRLKRKKSTVGIQPRRIFLCWPSTLVDTLTNRKCHRPFGVFRART